jgi:hypothetical protein
MLLHVICNFVAGISIVSIVTVHIVRKLGLVEVSTAIITIPLDEVAKRVLNSQTICNDVVTVDLEASAHVVLRIVDNAIDGVVAAPQPSVIYDDVARVDLEHCLRCDFNVLVCADTSKHIMDGAGCRCITGIALGAAKLEESRSHMFFGSSLQEKTTYLNAVDVTDLNAWLVWRCHECRKTKTKQNGVCIVDDDRVFEMVDARLQHNVESSRQLLVYCLGEAIIRTDVVGSDKNILEWDLVGVVVVRRRSSLVELYTRYHQTVFASVRHHDVGFLDDDGRHVDSGVRVAFIETAVRFWRVLHSGKNNVPDALLPLANERVAREELLLTARADDTVDRHVRHVTTAGVTGHDEGWNVLIQVHVSVYDHAAERSRLRYSPHEFVGVGEDVKVLGSAPEVAKCAAFWLLLLLSGREAGNSGVGGAFTHAVHSHVVTYVDLELVGTGCEENSKAVRVELTVAGRIPPTLRLLHLVDDLLRVFLTRLQDFHVISVPGGRVGLRARKGLRYK